MGPLPCGEQTRATTSRLLPPFDSNRSSPTESISRPRARASKADSVSQPITTPVHCSPVHRSHTHALGSATPPQLYRGLYLRRPSDKCFQHSSAQEHFPLGTECVKDACREAQTLRANLRRIIVSRVVRNKSCFECELATRYSSAERISVLCTNRICCMDFCFCKSRQ